MINLPANARPRFSLRTSNKCLAAAPKPAVRLSPKAPRMSMSPGLRRWTELGTWADLAWDKSQGKAIDFSTASWTFCNQNDRSEKPRLIYVKLVPKLTLSRGYFVENWKRHRRVAWVMISRNHPLYPYCLLPLSSSYGTSHIISRYLYLENNRTL